MGTRYHLLFEAHSEKLSQVMQHIKGAYTTYFKGILSLDIRHAGVLSIK